MSVFDGGLISHEIERRTRTDIEYMYIAVQNQIQNPAVNVNVIQVNERKNYLLIRYNLKFKILI